MPGILLNEVNYSGSGSGDNTEYTYGAAHAGFTPIGTIISVMGTTAPQNYLSCDGTAYNISDYPELAAYFNAQFGSSNFFGGDGITTFAVPDLRGEFLRGTGTNSHTNQGSGANVGVHQDGTAQFYCFMQNNGNSLYVRKNSGLDAAMHYTDKTFNWDTTKALRNVSYSASGETSTSENFNVFTSRPTNTSVLYCIATKNIYVDARFDYSLEEKVVGTWVNGKPIYQKTFEFGYLPNTTNKNVTIPITNLERIIDYKISATDGTRTLPIPYISDGSMDVQLFFTGTEVRIITLTDRTAYSAMVTLQYTKTTDTPS